MSIEAPSAEFLVAGEDSQRAAAFDPWRIAATDRMRALVGEVVKGALLTEGHFKLRQRQRRPEDARIFREIIEAVVCDVTYQHIVGPRPVRVPRDAAKLARASRYNSELLSKQLPHILDLLDSKMGILSQRIGSRSAMHRLQTEVAAGPWLADRIKAHGFTIHDTSRKGGEELIMLRDVKDQGAELVEYVDDERTTRLRADVRSINDYLRDASIEFDAAAAPGRLVDIHLRHLKRHFTRGQWNSGGRLFGGFWQNLRKRERLQGLRVNGESVVSLDYRSMGAVLAYSHAGKPMPDGDAYALPLVYVGGGEATSIPRDTCKALLNAALFASSRFKKWPASITPPPGVPIRAALETLEVHHAALAPLFYRGIGHALQFTESEILVDVLLKLKAANVPALPIHDCIVIAASDTEEARRVMEAAFLAGVGIPAGIAVESAY
jgi:hypothetical protein